MTTRSSPLDDHILRTLASVHPDSRVLYLGLSSNRVALMLSNLGFRVTGFDADRQLVNATLEMSRRFTQSPEAGPVPELYSGEWAPLPFEGRFFDWVIASEIWQRLSDEACTAVVNECARVIKAGAWMTVTSPVNPGNTSIHYQNQPREFQDLLGLAGFQPAEAWRTLDHESEPSWHAIFRFVEEDVTG